MHQFVVLLYLDASAEEAVESLRRRLGASGFAAPTATNAAVRPHISLAVCTGLDLERFRPELARVAAETSMLRCSLASLGVFPTEEGVIFLAPAPTRALIDLQERMVDRLGRVGAEVAPYWVPGSWVPHCTLAIGIPRDRIDAALGAGYEALQPIAGQLTRVSLIDVDLGTSCYGFDLRPIA